MTTPTIAAPAPRTSFAAWSSALASYGLVARHPVDFIRLAWAWIVLAHVIGYLCSYLAIHLSQSGIALLGAIVVALCAAAFAVKWHRRALLGMAATGTPLALGAHDAAFIGRALLLLLAGMAPLAVLMLLVTVAAFSDAASLIAITLLLCFVGALAILYVLIRFSLILPAAAIGETLAWRESWAATAGMSLRLWGGALATTLPLAIVAKLIENLAIFVMYQFQMLPLALVFGALTTVLIFIAIAVAASYTSLAYRALVRR